MLLAGVATVDPIKVFSQSIFACLFLIFIICHVGWDGSTEEQLGRGRRGSGHNRTAAEVVADTTSVSHVSSSGKIMAEEFLSRQEAMETEMAKKSGTSEKKARQRERAKTAEGSGWETEGSRHWKSSRKLPVMKVEDSVIQDSGAVTLADTLSIATVSVNYPELRISLAAACWAARNQNSEPVTWGPRAASFWFLRLGALSF